MHTLKAFITTTLISVLSFYSQNSIAQLAELITFGSNPGELSGQYYSPNINKPALVVLLHGCAQQSEDLAQQSGLLNLAKQHNFALLLPQQALTNNIKGCFNWYSAEDYTKNTGESLSIKNMVVQLKHQLNSTNVYIVGLSAGGAMASSMLVNYPELFTAGAVVAGIPFPCADGLITGISCMKHGPSQTPEELVALIKKIKPKQTYWPKLSIWTGKKDNIVNPLNASVLAEQWAQLSHVMDKPMIDNQSGYKVTQWQNEAKEVQVELIEVNQLGHGIMVNPDTENGGEASGYLLAAPVSTAQHLVRLWGL
jgi:poly(hydroxyalkanoate) depolymerase family esterase